MKTVDKILENVKRSVRVHADPNTSEVAGEYASIEEALHDDTTYPPGSELIRNGEVVGVYSVSGMWYLTAIGEHYLNQ